MDLGSKSHFVLNEPVKITFQNNMEELFCLQQLKCKKCLGKQIGGSKCGFMEATVDLV